MAATTKSQQKRTRNALPKNNKNSGTYVNTVENGRQSNVPIINLPFTIAEVDETPLIEDLVSPVWLFQPSSSNNLDGFLNGRLDVDNDDLYVVDQVGLIYVYRPQIEAARVRATKIDGTSFGLSYEDAENRQVFFEPAWLDVRDKLSKLSTTGADERGLLTAFFHPNDPSRLFLWYSSPHQVQNNKHHPKEEDEEEFDHDMVLAEYSVQPAVPLLAGPEPIFGKKISEQFNRTVNRAAIKIKPSTKKPRLVRELVRWSHPESNHNGSLVGFSPISPLDSIDGTQYLIYLSTGDGGGANDQHGPIGFSQNLNNVWGKMWALDVDNEKRYMVTNEDLRALGLRNLWRGSWLPDGRHIVGGDVGQDRREGVLVINAVPFSEEDGETDVLPPQNFGWRALEMGRINDPELFAQLKARDPEVFGEIRKLPTLWYTHELGNSVIGGYFVPIYSSSLTFSGENDADEEDRGVYVYGDWKGDGVWDNIFVSPGTFSPETGELRLDAILRQPATSRFPGSRSKTNDRPHFIQSFARDNSNNLYVLLTEKAGGLGSHGGQVRRLHLNTSVLENNFTFS